MFIHVTFTSSGNLARSAGNTPSKDPVDVENTVKLQQAARKLILKRYGAEPYRVEMKLKFPDSMPDYKFAGADGTIILELGPLVYVPYSVHLVRSYDVMYFICDITH